MANSDTPVAANVSNKAVFALAISSVMALFFFLCAATSTLSFYAPSLTSLWPITMPLATVSTAEASDHQGRRSTVIDLSYASYQAPDPDGFDPAADTVGAGIYSGKVKRDADGNILIGTQYENHNPVPGPLYAGGGYTEIAQAIHQGPKAVRGYLASKEDPKVAANEVMTGGATPLHTCGMSQVGQLSTQLLIDAGADIEALDTYGYTPLHRMASNDLDIGAEALLRAGADVNRPTAKGFNGDTPLMVAMQSGAKKVARVLERYGGVLYPIMPAEDLP